MSRKPTPIRGARSVMAGRKERDNSRDDFWTPPWATRALMEVVLPHCYEQPRCPSKPSVWEPACGKGHMAEVLKAYFRRVRATDIHNYGYGDAFGDFLTLDLSPVDWIITNPPFRGKGKGQPRQDRALEFTLRALSLARVGVAMFVRTQWAVEGVDRHKRLFCDNPPTLFAPFTERVNLCKGRWDPDGSTATAYCWLVWVKEREPMAPFYIPPGQRKALSRPDDRARFAAWSLPQTEAAE
jgi:hypothetical protein